MSFIRRSYYILTTLLIVVLLFEILSILILPQVNVYNQGLAENGQYIWNTKAVSGNLRLNERMEYGELYPFEAPPENVIRVVQLGSSVALFSNGALGKALKEKGHEVQLIDCTVTGSNILNSFYIYLKKCSQYKGVDYVVLQTTTSIENASAFLFPREIPVQDQNIQQVLFSSGNKLESKFQTGAVTTDSYGFLNRMYDPQIINHVNELSSPKNPFYYWSNLSRIIENKSVTKRVKVRNARPDAIGRASEFSGRILRKLAEEVQKNSSKLVIANFPTQIYLHHHKLSKHLKDTDVADSDRTIFKRNPLSERQDFLLISQALSDLKKGLEGNGIDFIDVTEFFENYDSDTLFAEDRYHLGQKGNKVGFRAVAERMK